MFEAVAHHQAVLADHRDDVGNGGDRDEIDEFLEIEVHLAGLQQGVAEFENHASGAEVGEIIAAFRVHQGAAIRPHTGDRFVVIDDQDVDAVGPQGRDFVDGNRAAIDRNQEVGFGALRHAAFERRRAEAVAFRAAARDEVAGFQAVGHQNPPHQGDRCHAIDVVIAVNQDGLALVDGLQQPLHCGVHVGNQEGIRQVLQPRAQVALQIDTGRKAPLADQVLQDRWKRTRRTGFLNLERFTTRNPSEGLRAHDCAGT